MLLPTLQNFLTMWWEFNSISFMLREARLDLLGALHYIIVLEINKFAMG